MTSQRDQLIRRVSRSVIWAKADQLQRDTARFMAIRIVDDLLNGSAEGKATERAVKSIVTRIEKSA